MITASTPALMTMSTKAVLIVASGKTSRGHRTLFTIDDSCTRVIEPREHDVEKNDHGMSPR